MKVFSKYLGLFVAMALLISAFAISGNAEDSRLEALEARVETLEQQIAELLAERDALAEPTAIPFAIGETLTFGEGLTMTVNGYETGDRFRYYPSGGFSTTTLTAKAGYRLLCLYITVDNKTGRDVYASSFLDAEVLHGRAYSSQARDTFFYLTGRGMYAGGLRTIANNVSLEGCLLFAIPEAAETSSESIAMQFKYNGSLYACTLRDSESLLPDSGEATDF